MIEPDPDLEPDWDEDNISHIATHGIRPNQVEEIYYERKHQSLEKRSPAVG